MTLAAPLLLAVLAATKRLTLPAPWWFVILQAICLFSLNFVALRNAAALIPSGLLSVVFSLASIFNAVNARMLFAEKSPFRVFNRSFVERVIVVSEAKFKATEINDPSEHSQLFFDRQGSDLFPLPPCFSRRRHVVTNLSCMLPRYVRQRLHL